MPTCHGSGEKGGGGGGNGGITNDYQSEYGLPNVGNLEEVRTIGGITSKGTVAPTVSDVQEYFDLGVFDNWGTNSGAKKEIARRITRDMSRRGFDISLAEDGAHILLEGNTAKSVTLGRKNDKWVAKGSNSSGTKSQGGMRGALTRASRATLKKK